MPGSNNILIEKVKKTLHSHQIWLESHGRSGKLADLSGLDLRHIDLRKFNLQRANLSKSIFNGSDLSHINFYSANLQDADLREANLEGTRLEEANLERANLRGASLERSDLRGANLNRTDLSEANLEEACLVEASIQKANLERANLSSADLEGAFLENSNLFKAILNDANLEDANLDGANLKEAELRKSNLFCASIDQADFEKADLKNAILDRVDIDETYFTDANLEGVQFHKKVHRYVEMSSVKLNFGEKTKGRKGTSNLFSEEISSYINAVVKIEKLICEINNRPASEIRIDVVSRDSDVRIEISGAKEIITFIKKEVLAWRAKHSDSLSRLSDIEEKNQILQENAKVMALDSLINASKHDAVRLAAKALKITAEMMRNEIEAEKIRRMNNQKQLADSFIEKVILNLPEIEKGLIQQKIRSRLNLIIESNLVD